MNPLRVVITGASSGVGAALAREYAKRGAVLGLIARRRELVERLRAELPGEHAAYAVDVRDAQAMRAAAADFCARCGGADVVIGNAGVSIGTLTDRAEDSRVPRDSRHQRGGDVQHLPAVRRAHASTRQRIARGHCQRRGLPRAARRGSLLSVESRRDLLSRKPARGVACERRRVVTISPGYIATPMTERNPYPMPFILSADEAARRIARAIERRRPHSVIPWQMGLVGGVLKALPRPIYDRLFARAPRKPRRSG
jgi:short-subunit dehydrogenase